MRVFGMNYDTGFVSAGSTTHEPFDPETVRRDLRVISDELHCEAVRITGGVQDRLELAAGFAAEAGLEVWYCPFTNGLDRDGLMAFVLDGAERAERLRRSGASVVYLTGSEIAMFTDGFLPGCDLAERMALFTDPMRMREAVPAARAAVRDFLAEAVPAVRERFDGPVGYASIPLEAVDWAAFDIIASDAGYRDATTAAAFPQTLAATVGQGKPYAATEFGCCTFRGAADVAGAAEPVTYDEHGRGAKLTAELERDEEGQARYLMDLLRDYEAGGVEAAFVYTFANRHLPTTGDPERDFDLAARDRAGAAGRLVDAEGRLPRPRRVRPLARAEPVGRLDSAGAASRIAPSPGVVPARSARARGRYGRLAKLPLPQTKRARSPACRHPG